MFRDFTEELWTVLLKCQSNEDLIEALGFVFNALKSGYRNTMVSFSSGFYYEKILRFPVYFSPVNI